VTFSKKAGSPLDGADPNAVYQMVPAGGGVREGWTVESGAEPVEVAFAPPGVASFGARTFRPPTSFPIDDRARMFVESKSAVDFAIVGHKPGNTTLFIRDSKGKALKSLLVSVKAEVPKSYSLIRLTDAVISTSPWDPGAINRMMQIVEKTYLDQANIRLFKVGEIFDLNMKTDVLGDPIILDQIVTNRRVVPPLAATLEFHLSNHASLPSAQQTSDVRIFFTWNISMINKNIAGRAIGKACFVEFNNTRPSENAQVTAHEIGHILGLGHSSINNMMAEFTIGNSMRLRQFEIDTINRTDETAAAK
jgi:hypothetical protein